MCVSVGLLTASALAVHITHGLTEAHFHFFVVVIVLTVYEDWFAFLTAVAYVVLHHGVMGTIDRNAVFDHGGDPWMWAGIHGAFVLAAGVGAIAAWRLNEDVRSRAGEVEQRFRSAFDDAAIGMALTSLDGRFIQVNRALCELIGYSEDELTAVSFQAITHPDDVAVGAEALVRLRTGELRTFSTEKRYIHAAGHAVWISLNVSVVTGSDGLPGYMVAQMQDVTERRRAEADLAHQAMHDALTGLPNRALFMDRLGVALSHLDRRPWPLAVMFVDVDRFKLINDSLGHQSGDDLLRALAERLRTTMRGSDTVARIAGDEFTILCQDLADESEGAVLAERLVAALRDPFTVGGREIFVSASIGVANVHDGRLDADSLLAQADAAMYQAKGRGGSRFEIFCEGMRPRVAERLELEHALRLGIARDELRLRYQTEVSLQTGAVCGLEALVRWEHPERGLLSPDEFIPAAEETGLIVPLGNWVLREACRQMAEWAADGVFGPEVRIAVNVSALQLSDRATVGQVRAALADHGLRPDRLCLEVTESALTDGAGQAVETLRQIKAMGVQIAIDDFGTGFSSLARLKELPPVDLVKIDRSFVAGLGVSVHDGAIVSSVLNLADALGVPVVAEGVETTDQASRLRGLGCSLGQGYLFSRPIAAADVTALAQAVAAA
jgi:diguanylate cyclase (GGDEF)-like protein/PAS domain S-box-containing protein